MTPTDALMTPPSALLLATDLSCRCDRAMDRAADLARRWNARLVALTVIDPGQDMQALRRSRGQPSWRQGPDPLEMAEFRLRADLGAGQGDDVPALTVRVATGDPADAIARVARETGCGLIVTGVARDEPFGRMLLGNTTQQLVRRSMYPVLVVRNRVRGAYARVVTGTNFSTASRHGLEVATHWFPGAAHTLFHAYDMPYGTLAGGPVATQDLARRIEAGDAARFVAGARLPGDLSRPLQTVVEVGAPTVLLGDYASDHATDLVVLGAQRRSALLEALLGSTTQRLLENLPSDTLLVPEPDEADTAAG